MEALSVSFKGHLEGFELDVAFDIPSRGITALFGQSGCGKTTVLRCLAGLHRIEQGKMRIGVQVWQDEKVFVPVHERAIGYVFQDANLFDHLSVRGNLEFARKRSARKHTIDLDEITRMMGLGDLLDRRPLTLSGGEKQRVAIARALASGPEILLMDEPLSALDRFSKDDIIPYLERLGEELAIPIVFISHDTDEVERLADYLVVMERGHVRASGPLLDVLSDPSLFIARSAKTASLLEATIIDYDEHDQLSCLRAGNAEIFVPGYVGEVGQTRRVRIAATDVSLALEKPSKTTILNVMVGEIEAIHSIDGARVNIVLCLGGEGATRLIARISTRSLRGFGFQVGQTVYAQVKGVSMVERRGK